jgi:hypothetical protein
MSLAGLSLQALPSLLPIDPTLNVSLRALASAHIRAPPAALDVSDSKSVRSALAQHGLPACAMRFAAPAGRGAESKSRFCASRAASSADDGEYDVHELGKLLAEVRKARTRTRAHACAHAISEQGGSASSALPAARNGRSGAWHRRRCG